MNNLKVVLLVMISVMVFVSCESRLILPEETAGEAGAGIWFCLGDLTTGDNTVSKYSFEGSKMAASSLCQWAICLDVDDGNGNIWYSSVNSRSGYHVSLILDTGEEEASLSSTETGFLFSIVNLSVDNNSHYCWGAAQGIKEGDFVGVLRFNTDCTLDITVEGFVTPSFVTACPSDGGCWVSDAGAKKVVKLNATGQRVLERGFQLLEPGRMMVNSTDDSCWVVFGNHVVHFSNEGQQLGNIELEETAHALAVDVSDGSVYVGVGDSFLEKYSSGHRFLWRYYAGGTISDIDVATDGSIWLCNRDTREAYHITSAGDSLLSYPLPQKPTALRIREE